MKHPKLLPKLVHFFDPVLYSFRSNFGALFRYFFRLLLFFERNRGEAAFLKEVPSEIVDFKGPGILEPSQQGVLKRAQKRTPKNERISYILGVCFGLLGRLLGLSWGTLLPLCRILGQEGHKGKPKSSPRAAQEPPEETLDRPRDAQGQPKRA